MKRNIFYCLLLLILLKASNSIQNIKEKELNKPKKAETVKVPEKIVLDKEDKKLDMKSPGR